MFRFSTQNVSLFCSYYHPTSLIDAIAGGIRFVKFKMKGMVLSLIAPILQWRMAKIMLVINSDVLFAA
jgi:hypothetical protein